MCGIRFWAVLGASIYPVDEPSVPASVHISRALGGPAISALITLAAALAAFIFRPLGPIAAWIGLVFFLENLLVFTLGAFLPLGFTDGSTLLAWWGKR